MYSQKSAPSINTASAEKNETEIYIGTLSKVNYLLVILGILILPCSFTVPILYQHRYGYIALSVLILSFEAVARPFYYYGASSKGLAEYRFGKKLRLIEWNRIIQVGQQLELLGRGSKRGVIVTLVGAPKYTTQTKLKSFRYYLAYRPNVLYIYDFYKSMPIIEKFYGPADYISKDDLSQ